MTPEPLDPEKYHRFDLMSLTTKRLIVAGVLFVVFVLVPLLMLAYYKTAVRRPNQTENDVTLVVEKGEGIADIASNLYETSAINSEFLFKLYLVINNLHNNIQAGAYVIPAGTSTAELAQILQHGTNDRTITFLEGWRLEEYAMAASKIFAKIDYKDFIFLAHEDDAEGYLFPDTYEFNVDVSEEEMIKNLRDNFQKRTEDMLTAEKLEASGLTKDEVLIFASILEREINTEADRPIVAGILLKRWREGTKLDADATTQYAVAAARYGCTQTLVYDLNEDDTDDRKVCPDGELIPNIDWWPDDLTTAELQSENPYNTRAVVGLPPTPISNPGLSAIEAVLNPVETEYYYYLTASDGTTYYAETLDEHNSNVENHL